MLQTIECSFERLMKIRVERMMSPQRPVEGSRRQFEIRHMPVRLQTIERMRDGHLMVRLLPSSPEPATNLHLRVTHIAKPLDRRLIGPGGAAYHARGNSTDDQSAA